MPSYQVYHVINAQNKIPLWTYDKRVGLYESYLQFKRGDMSKPGYRNYAGYLDQIRPYLVASKVVHFAVADDHSFGFQELKYVHSRGRVVVSSDGWWAKTDDRGSVMSGLAWIEDEQERLYHAQRRGTELQQWGDIYAYN
ncbi:hypothetical protein TRVA0_011S02894 [Trichomonascus vanleenenianus]|uniref:uncharacterized protein n=1 Tax=Trichomonascus vanleenenianus TaxID=2268995 RepID=UPI003EC99C60